MALDNYRDISSYGNNSPGFQFEFYCSNCSRTWKTPFKPYRKGQVASFFSGLLMTFRGVRNVGYATRLASDAGLEGAKGDALAEGMARANTMYSVCSKCQRAACKNCFHDREGLCENCLNQSTERARVGLGESGGGNAGARQGDGAQQAPAMSCPNCRSPHDGGRFCAECGFDLAGTHKSCPDCGAMALRQARYCNDCGHGF
jgi:hypothetical protein